MTNFSMTASGGLFIKGCGSYSFVKNYPYKYTEGSVVCVRDKAINRGKIEKIAIKKVILNSTQTRWNQPLFVYLDMDNWAWLEYELCYQYEAITFAEAYWQERLLLSQELVNECGNS